MAAMVARLLSPPVAGAAARPLAAAAARRAAASAAGAACAAAAEAASEAPFVQDRISSNGQLLPCGSGRGPAAATAAPAAGGAGAPPTAPPAPPISAEQLEELVAAIESARGATVVLTGAGCSTESSIPDYRSPGGAYSTGFKPMSHQTFMSSEANRKRYWARSFAGWAKFSSVRPNAAHDALARLQALGWIRAVITQNVDRLHQRAGSAAVVELHGSTHDVVCTSCGALSDRGALQARLAQLNPEFAAAAAALSAAEDAAEDDAARLRLAGTPAAVGASLREARALGGGGGREDGEVAVPVRRPDGDVELRGASDAFVVPPCDRCGGFLKPEVTFFGDSVDPGRAAAAAALVSECRTLLVAGSSLAVWSAMRLVRAAKADAGARLAVVNIGPTRADKEAALGAGDVRVEARVGEALARAAAHPTLLVPPVG